MFPVTDTLPHQASEPVTIQGRTYKKGTFFIGTFLGYTRFCTNFFTEAQFFFYVLLYMYKTHIWAFFVIWVIVPLKNI